MLLPERLAGVRARWPRAHLIGRGRSCCPAALFVLAGRANIRRSLFIRAAKAQWLLASCTAAAAASAYMQLCLRVLGTVLATQRSSSFGCGAEGESSVVNVPRRDGGIRLHRTCGPDLSLRTATGSPTLGRCGRSGPAPRGNKRRYLCADVAAVTPTGCNGVSPAGRRLNIWSCGPARLRSPICSAGMSMKGHFWAISASEHESGRLSAASGG